MPENHALMEEKSRLRAVAFRDAEASLLLEGLDPTADPAYCELKAQFIAGKITFEEAKASIREQYRAASVSPVPVAVSA